MHQPAEGSPAYLCCQHPFVFQCNASTFQQLHANTFRDLKPENFLLSNKDPNAPLKATDFGLSVFYHPGQTFTDIVGSAYYVAPEVMLSHFAWEALHPRSTIKFSTSSSKQQAVVPESN